MDFSVVSGSAGLLLWAEMTGIGALFGMHLITLLVQTACLILSLMLDTTRLILVHFYDRSSSIVFIVPQRNSHSVLTMLFPDGSNGDGNLPTAEGSYSLALITTQSNKYSSTTLPCPFAMFLSDVFFSHLSAL